MRLPTWNAALALGLSGFAALLYEVVWVRLLGDVFGHTAHAVYTVLAVLLAWHWAAPLPSASAGSGGISRGCTRSSRSH